jgi:hypothetical protein
MLSMSWVLCGSVIVELSEESFGLVKGRTGLAAGGVEGSTFGKGERGRGGEGPYRRRVSYWRFTLAQPLILVVAKLFIETYHDSHDPF